MQTFSIAVGSYTLPDETAMMAGAESVEMLGGVPPDINTVEAQQAKAEHMALNPPVPGAEPAPAPEPAAEVHPLHIGAGDTVVFGVDPADYSICVLTAQHPDGSSDWLKIKRNGFLIESGWTPAPPPPDTTESGSAGTTASATDSIDVPQEDPPAEEEFAGSHSGRGHRNKRSY